MFWIDPRTIHVDWYRDGAEFGIDGSGEEMWRLDFSNGGNEFQAQLFCEIACTIDEWDALGEEQMLPFKWVRLFLERDNRIGPGGPRWDYACENISLSPDEAADLLTCGKNEAVAVMSTAIKKVATLANERDFVLQSADSDAERAQIREYWRLNT